MQGHTSFPPRLTARFLLADPAHFIALGAGAGLSRFAPGTVGTLWAWAAFSLMAPWLTPQQMGCVILLTALLAIWASMRTAQHLQISDPSAVVIDEIVAFWLVLWFIRPTTFWAECGAFIAFRLFDSIKIGPVGWADRLFKGFGWRGGFGILFDDLVAAFCVLLVFAWVRF